MDQAGQPHAVEMAAAAQTTQVVATVEAVLASRPICMNIEGSQQRTQTSKQNWLRSRPRTLTCKHESTSWRSSSTHPGTKRCWPTRANTCWVVVAAVMGVVFGLIGWLKDKETVLFAVAVLSIVQSINNTAMLAAQLLS
ncbi:hypothetical protein ACK3TF_004712 [Chlorella vulgaris]